MGLDPECLEDEEFLVDFYENVGDLDGLFFLEQKKCLSYVYKTRRNFLQKFNPMKELIWSCVFQLPFIAKEMILSGFLLSPDWIYEDFIKWIDKTNNKPKRHCDVEAKLNKYRSVVVSRYLRDHPWG